MEIGNITHSTNSTMNLVNTTDQQSPNSLFDLDAQSLNITDSEYVNATQLENLRRCLMGYSSALAYFSRKRFYSFRLDMVICLTVLFALVFLILLCARGIEKRNSELELRESRLQARVKMLEQIHKQA